MEKSYKVAIIGKPNVGKSSLFNRIIADQVSIVHKDAGVTRDRVQQYGSLRFTSVKIYDHPFYIEDTPGIDFDDTTPLRNHIMSSVSQAIDESDLGIYYSLSVFFVVDGLHGPTKDDHDIARWLRDNFEFYSGNNVEDELSDVGDPLAPKLNKLESEANSIKPALLASSLPDLPRRRKRVRLLASKCDSGDRWDMINDLYALNLGDPIFCSAQQGDGIHEVIREVNLTFPPQVLEDYRLRRKLRRARYEVLRSEMAADISAELTRRSRDFDIRRF